MTTETLMVVVAGSPFRCRDRVPAPLFEQVRDLVAGATTEEAAIVVTAKFVRGALDDDSYAHLLRLIEAKRISKGDITVLVKAIAGQLDDDGTIRPRQ